ncbi:MAG: 3-dehydroquinate synthase [Clostridiales bacterium]|nr:3-dehydroquinate synthase [Clostridiales bacterium]
MIKVTVNASNKYDVLIGKNLLENTANYIKEIGLNGKVLVVTDKNVDKLYAKTVVDNLLNNGFVTVKYVVKGGEKSKSGKEYLKLLEFLAKNEFTRSDFLIALGGGVVGDLTGFVASTYLRGISFVQIPTTILAFADSSVGGKTAINLKFGKNLVGAFYQPKLVICDVLTANTLTKKDYASGMAEVIKYGMLFDKELIEVLSKENDLEKVIKASVEWKKKVVESDEKDNGERQLLNFGHTLGHAIEKESNFKISHGSAVAIGMRIITQKAVNKGLCDKKCLAFLDLLLNKYNLPTKTDIKLEKLVEKSLIDKKRKGDYITVVMPIELGFCKLQKMTIKEWKNFILNDEN